MEYRNVGVAIVRGGVMEEAIKEMLRKQPCELTGEAKKLFDAIMKIADERDELRRKIEVKDQYLELITDIGFDYDGCESPNHLKELIDELVGYANKAIDCRTDTVEFTGAGGTKFNILHEEIK